MNGLILIIALILTILLILGYCNLIKKYGKKDLSIGHLIYDFIDIYVCLIFLLVSIFMIYISIISKTYVMLIIPIGWFFIIYIHIKKMIKRDLEIDINFIKNYDERKLFKGLVGLLAGIGCFIGLIKVLVDTVTSSSSIIDIIIPIIMIFIASIIFCTIGYHFIKSSKDVDGK